MGVPLVEPEQIVIAIKQLDAGTQSRAAIGHLPLLATHGVRPISSAAGSLLFGQHKPHIAIGNPETVAHVQHLADVGDVVRAVVHLGGRSR